MPPSSLFRTFALSLRSRPCAIKSPSQPLYASVSRSVRNPTVRAFHTRHPLRQYDRRQLSQRPRNYGYDHEQAQRARPLLSNDAFRSPSFKIIMVTCSGAAFIFFFANQETVPISNRRRFNCFSPEAAEQQGLQAYQQIINQERSQGKILPDWDPRVKQVKRVLNKLIEGGQLGDGGSAKGTGWEVNVIEDPHTQNAFVLPGGKVFVYSGILPICATDDGLAAVLGHEIAHNIAQHTAERMSSAIPITIMGYVFLFLDYTGVTMGLGHYVGSIALEFGVNRPSSRQQESEADYIGLILMAQSCYDPRAAVGLWQRMEKAQQGNPPEWMSTHPSNEHRIERIQEWLPKAEEKSAESNCAPMKTYTQDFRRTVGFPSLSW